MKYAIRKTNDYTGENYYTYFRSRNKALKEFREYRRRENAGECFACVDLVDMHTGEIIISL